jgi:plastocyanin
MMNQKPWVTVIGLCMLLGLALLTACSKKESTEEGASPATSAAPATAATPIDPATAASVSGTVSFAGTAPKGAKIDMSQDPACKGTNSAETVVVDGNNLSNVFVYVKDGLGNRTFDVPKDPITIDQSGCKYHPHVLGVMTGQTLKIVNSDPTTHNIHPTPKDNREWNESQPPQSAALEKNFAREEIMLPVKCNQHPWMKMYVNVVKSPFYAVTGPDGKFEIKGLPPGDYTLAFVQEKLGEQDQKVTLAAKDSKVVNASFKSE